MSLGSLYLTAQPHGTGETRDAGAAGDAPATLNHRMQASTMTVGSASGLNLDTSSGGGIGMFGPEVHGRDLPSLPVLMDTTNAAMISRSAANFCSYIN
eukprot:m.295467 g.295467  ORF g.295467 m.295467 type:complete len:98 (+) comp20040_c0_seq2:1157-1450(+)